MKKLTLIPIILILLLSNITASGQTTVNSRNTRYQVEREVFIRWNKFRPKWYFWLFHNKYRKGPDRRNIIQLLPTAAFVRINLDDTMEEKEDIDTLYAQAIWREFNIVAESHYHLHFKKIFNNLNNDIDEMLAESLELGIDAEHYNILSFEQERINEHLKIIREGHLENGDSQEAMKDIQHEFEELRGSISKLLGMYRLIEKYN